MAGNIQKRPDGKWRARYRDPTGRERSKHFSRKRDAEHWLASISTSVGKGDWLDPALARVTVGEWAMTWLDQQVQLKPTTRERYAVALRRQILPTWGQMKLDQVSHAGVSLWVAQLTVSHLSAGTVRYAHRVFALLLEHAVRDRRILSNPAQHVRLPRTVAAPHVFLSHQQVHTFAKAAGRYQTLILTLAYTGLRWGEAAALTVGGVDLQGRRILVQRATSEVRGHVMFGTPKSHQQRSVPIPAFLVDALNHQIEGRSAEELLFTSAGGGVLRNTNFRRRVFDPAAASVGLKNVTPHTLRHTAASLAIASGASVKAVQRMLGHASAAMTLDVYAGLFSADLDALGERLDAEVTRLVGTPDADQMRTVGSTDHRDGQPRTGPWGRELR